jgi:hypothetical protein
MIPIPPTSSEMAAMAPIPKVIVDKMLEKEFSKSF